MPFQPSPTQVKEAAKSVQYEWMMFNSTFDFFPVAKRFRGVLQNATLESFLVHARIFANFFFPPGDGQRKEGWDDMRASDYIPEWKFTRKPHLLEKCSYLGEHYDRIDKALAHLSYSRSSYKEENKKEWECDTIYKELSGVWDDFWGQLTDEKRGWFSQ